MKRIGSVVQIAEGGEGDYYGDHMVQKQTVSLTLEEVRRLWAGCKRVQSPKRRRPWAPAVTRRPKALQLQLVEQGLVAAPGCRCSACERDYDCCGRMVPGWPVISRIGRRTFRVEQAFHRNC